MLTAIIRKRKIEYSEEERNTITKMARIEEIGMTQDASEAGTSRKSKDMANKKLNEMKKSEHVAEVNLEGDFTVIRENVSEVNLNLEKPYSKFSEHCDRDLFKIHKPIENKGERGSVKDERLVYCEFKAGVFAALRLHMIRILKTDFYGKIVKNPKIQTNGTGKNEAETRKIVDVKITVEGKDHKVQFRTQLAALTFRVLEPNRMQFLNI